MYTLAHLYTVCATILLLWQPLAAAHGLNHFPSLREEQQFNVLKFSSNKTAPQGPTATECHSRSCYRYYNNKTSPYFIKNLPDVAWNIGEFYSGSIPIDESDPSRTLFFVFKPAMSGPVDEVTIWLNGGPGCSSLIGFFQENGPILWQAGTEYPRRNPYTWANMTNMLWVEQPVGTGFAQGKIEAKGEVDIAKDFVGFFKNWEKLFGIENYKIYMTGESYAGRYVPYIAAQMLDQNDTTYFDLSGALVYDPCIGDCGYVQMVVPMASFITANNVILNYPQSTISEMQDLASKCGLTEYMDKYLTFPPPHAQPVSKDTLPKGCDKFFALQDSVYDINSCYNIYHITDYCPILTDEVAKRKEPYFNRTDVKQAMHAPLDVNWKECGEHDVFPHGDAGPWSVNGPLPQVIEATNRVIVGNADWDMLILTNGTLLEIQNMTWHGELGFQSAPSTDLYVPLGPFPNPHGEYGPQGIMGRQHYERGLLWVETYQSGHEQPQYQPRVTLMHLMWLLGRIDTIPSGP